MVARKHFGKCAKTAASRRKSRELKEQFRKRENAPARKYLLDPLDELQEKRAAGVTRKEEKLVPFWKMCPKTAASRGERREQGAEGVIQKEGKDTLDPLDELQEKRAAGLF